LAAYLVIILFSFDAYKLSEDQLKLLFSGVFCGKGFDFEVEGAHTTTNV